MAYQDLTSDLEKVILKEICQSRSYSKSFEVIIQSLENKISEFNPLQNSFELEPFFGEKKQQSNFCLNKTKLKKNG